MQIGLTRVSLNDVQGGELTSGIVPLSRTRRSFTRGTAAGAVVLSGAATNVLQVDCGSVVAGDMIIVSCEVGFLADLGAAFAYFFLSLTQGTAIVECADGFPGFTIGRTRVPLNDLYRGSACMLCLVTGNGTFLPRIQGYDLLAAGNATEPSMCALSAAVFYGG